MIIEDQVIREKKVVGNKLVIIYGGTLNTETYEVEGESKTLEYQL